jgi:HSP20 family protein
MKRQSETARPATASAQQGSVAGFASLCDEIDQLFEDIDLPDQAAAGPRADGAATLTPPVELKEMPDHYELAIELPGLERKDIRVELAGGVLVVAGEKHAQWEEKSGGCLMSERSYGAFRRRFSLPQDIDPDRIEAHYRHGVLKVSVGKDAAAQGRVRNIAVT